MKTAKLIVGWFIVISMIYGVITSSYTVLINSLVTNFFAGLVFSSLESGDKPKVFREEN